MFQQYLAESLLAPIKKWISRRKNFLDESAVTSGRTINNLLLELRVKMNADRVAIFLFHNGQYFNPNIINNSIWKFTCAYESCKAGVSYESSKMNNLLLTNYITLIESLWNKLTDGIERYDCKNCLADCDKEKNIITIVDYATLPHGNTKSWLESQGIQKLILSPIIINSDYVGFVGASYASNFTYGGQAIDATGPGGIKTICEYANTIGYQLSNKR